MFIKQIRSTNCLKLACSSCRRAVSNELTQLRDHVTTLTAAWPTRQNFEVVLEGVVESWVKRVVTSEFPNFYGKAHLVSNQKYFAFLYNGKSAASLFQALGSLSKARAWNTALPAKKFRTIIISQTFLILSAIDSSPSHDYLRLSSLVNY